MTQWLAAKTSLRFGQISGKFCCCLMVRRLYSVNKQKQIMALVIYLRRNVSFADHVALDGSICNIDMSDKQLLLACGSARQYNMYLEEKKV